MSLLPSCSHYIRRILRRDTNAFRKNALDLLSNDKRQPNSLNERLQILYPNRYEEVVLKLEQLVYSHQRAQAHRHHPDLKDINRQLLWWLGYSVDTHPAHAKVFVADDTIETIKLVTTLLTQYGYRTDSAFNGKLALAKIPSADPNLIILDINLPDMSGYQVYQTLQNYPATASIPVVFLSGVHRLKSIHPANNNRVGFLEKPFNSDDLIKCVNDYIKESSPREILTDSKRLAELKERRQYAQKLFLPFSEHLPGNSKSYEDYVSSHCFFRATLDGRYLRMSHAFSQLFGYASTEAMLSNITNVWEQCYSTIEHQKQWSVCLQSPNQPHTWPVKIRTRQNQVIDVVEHMSLVQDRYKRNLFYQGYLCLPSS